MDKPYLKRNIYIDIYIYIYIYYIFIMGHNILTGWGNKASSAYN